MSNYLRKLKIRWVELIFDGKIEHGNAHVDMYISIIQYLMRNGLKVPFNHVGNSEIIERYFNRCLFSIDNDRISFIKNHYRFDPYIFRSQFDILGENEIYIPKYYRFSKFTKSDVKKMENKLLDSLECPIRFQSAHIEVKPERLKYVMSYTKDGQDTVIEQWSNHDENYLDFISRICDNFDSVIKGTYI